MESQSIKQESSHPHLIKTQLDWSDSELCNSRRVETLNSHVVSFWFAATSHTVKERYWKGNDKRLKYWTPRHWVLTVKLTKHCEGINQVLSPEHYTVYFSKLYISVAITCACNHLNPSTIWSSLTDPHSRWNKQQFSHRITSDSHVMCAVHAMVCVNTTQHTYQPTESQQIVYDLASLNKPTFWHALTWAQSKQPSGNSNINIMACTFK